MHQVELTLPRGPLRHSGVSVLFSANKKQKLGLSFFFFQNEPRICYLLHEWHCCLVGYGFSFRLLSLFCHSNQYSDFIKSTSCSTLPVVSKDECSVLYQYDILVLQ